MTTKSSASKVNDPDAVLQSILAGTAAQTGEGFFKALVQQLCDALGTHGAWVTEYLPRERRLRALAFWLGSEWVDEYEYDIAGTPCEPVMDKLELLHVPDKVIELYPDDPDLPPVNAVSYLGIPLRDADGSVLGHLAVLDDKVMGEDTKLFAVFRIFAERAGAELRRMRADDLIRDREAQLNGLVTSAMDGVLQMDGDLRIVRMNPSAVRSLGIDAKDEGESQLEKFIAADHRERLGKLVSRIDARHNGAPSLWIPNGIAMLRANGDSFAAEATLSRFEVDDEKYFTLIFRNVNERLEAERRIELLTEESRQLREELGHLEHFNEFVGGSAALEAVLRDVRKVAVTDSTVLIYGETGTGKELVARAVHAQSDRGHKPLVRVNCAAIPANLMESEFFGHERGAFTGATERREGRFSLADGGTLFLDEVGDLPLNLQVKLLRVVQEGEYEPVGSNRTRRVDVRIVAATNRDLEAMAEAGEFREDLYYRLNVFPIQVPPLRARDEDIIRLAEHFMERFARSCGKPLEPLAEDDRRRLRAYTWPGNVRELQNVIERAVITAEDGRANLVRALPTLEPGSNALESSIPASPRPILNADEMRTLERDNITRALDACDWRISGPDGAAGKLGLPASTLASRVKVLKIKRRR